MHHQTSFPCSAKVNTFFCSVCFLCCCSQVAAPPHVSRRLPVLQRRRVQPRPECGTCRRRDSAVGDGQWLWLGRVGSLISAGLGFYLTGVFTGRGWKKIKGAAQGFHWTFRPFWRDLVLLLGLSPTWTIPFCFCSLPGFFVLERFMSALRVFTRRATFFYFSLFFIRWICGPGARRTEKL